MDLQRVALRFAVAFVLSLAFGVARQRAGKHIGFGTFIFVSLGSCGIALTALSFHIENPLPLLSAIVTGVGFLGAGALFRTPDRIVGFTSAATIWIFAVFGLAVGVGEYLVAGLVYAAIWITILLDQWMERRWFNKATRKVVVELGLDVPDGILESELGLPALGKARSVQLHRADGRVSVTYALDLREAAFTELARRLQASERVLSYAIE